MTRAAGGCLLVSWLVLAVAAGQARADMVYISPGQHQVLDNILHKTFFTDSNF